MPESFGARLRRTREEQQIALVTIAQQTKIKMSLLEGLERDDVSHWPSGIFRRAYIRAYAQSIGLDADTVVREFVQVHPEPDEVFEAALAQALAADAARVNGGSATRFRSLVDSALGSLSRLRRGSMIEGLDPAHDDTPHLRGFSPPHLHGEVESSRSPSSKGSLGAPTSLTVPEGMIASTFGSDPSLEYAALDTADDTGIDIAVANDPIAEGSDAPREEASSPIALDDPSAETGAPPVHVERDMDWAAVAWLCTELGRVDSLEGLQVLLQESAGLLDAGGLILWVWDDSSERLKAALAHGYSDKVLAHLPALRRESDNATAAAFRSAQTCAIDASDHDSGALAVPLQTSSGCSGVLAIELRNGGERSQRVRVAATIMAALLARLVDRPSAAEIEADERARAAEMEARAAEAQARAAEIEAFKSAVKRVHARR